MESIFWVYTRRTDLFHTSTDRVDQERYWRCVKDGRPFIRKLACIFEYLLDKVSVPIDVNRDDIYILPVVFVENDGETGVKIYRIVCDKHSLVEVVAILSPSIDYGLKYRDVVDILNRHKGSLIYPHGLPRDMQNYICYTTLYNILKMAKNDSIIRFLMEKYKNELFVKASSIDLGNE